MIEEVRRDEVEALILVPGIGGVPLGERDLEPFVFRPDVAPLEGLLGEIDADHLFGVGEGLPEDHRAAPGGAAHVEDALVVPPGGHVGEGQEGLLGVAVLAPAGAEDGEPPRVDERDQRVAAIAAELQMRVDLGVPLRQLEVGV